MERTEPYPVGTALLEADEVTHHVNDVGGVKNLLYCGLVNHLALLFVGGTNGIGYQ